MPSVLVSFPDGVINCHDKQRKGERVTLAHNSTSVHLGGAVSEREAVGLKSVEWASFLILFSIVE